MNINEEKRSQWQALKGMGFKAHWDYFWDYYKIHVIVAVIVVIVTISIVKDIVMQKPYALSCTFINTASMMEPDSIRDGFADYEKIDTSKFTIAIDSSSTIDLKSPDQYSIANSERIYAMIAARDLDVIMADETIFKNYVGNEIFQDLRNYYTEEELAALGDKVYYATPEDFVKETDPETGITPTEPAEDSMAKMSETEPVPVGIILENNPHLDEIQYYPGEKAYIGIVTASQRTDVAKDFIQYILN
ncbi:hypothetical protein [Butyrivibrio sp. XPD2002]|uniref:hypothetical protein n=1 Tax=Butyrivibrio sp. XPD2002 TaxID=1280665 RepID=UPI00041F10A0|nr:hypothetical protein [Butyrivibrio sp. XPD2002]